MAKSLSERIAERTRKKSPSRNAQNRAAFLALRGDVKQALDDGWPVKSIWETLHDESKVTFSYQAFRGYVNRLILSEKEASISSQTEKPIIEKKEVQEKIEPPKKRPAQIAGFVFQANPNEKDLI